MADFTPEQIQVLSDIADQALADQAAAAERQAAIDAAEQAAGEATINAS
jgi:hypothetical protein